MGWRCLGLPTSQTSVEPVSRPAQRIQNARTERPHSRSIRRDRSAHMRSWRSRHGTRVLRSGRLPADASFCAAQGEHGKPGTGNLCAVAVEVEPVSYSDKDVLSRLIEFYVYDYSEYMGWDVDAHGVFGYRYLDHYWTDA